MPKVFCVTEPIRIEGGEVIPLFDLTPAMKFGEIEILLKSNQSMLSPSPIIRSLRDKLENFTDEDMILPVGDPTMIAAVAAICADVNKGRFKMLKWDKRQRQYYVVSIDVSGRAT